MQLEPGARLLLVRPSDELIIAAWHAGPHGRCLAAEWVSPFPDLEAVVERADGRVTREEPQMDIAG